MRTVVIVLAASLIAVGGATSAVAQEGAATIGARLMQDAAVKNALERVRRDEGQVIDEQVRLCEIAAPPFKEQARGEALRRAFVASGLKNVRVDEVGNVIGPGLSARPRLVFTAHLDTVFPEGINVQTTREGTLINGPGALLLAMALAQK